MRQRTEASPWRPLSALRRQSAAAARRRCKATSRPVHTESARGGLTRRAGTPSLAGVPIVSGDLVDRLLIPRRGAVIVAPGMVHGTIRPWRVWIALRLSGAGREQGRDRNRGQQHDLRDGRPHFRISIRYVGSAKDGAMRAINHWPKIKKVVAECRIIARIKFASTIPLHFAALRKMSASAI